jgi:hypothetical protein
MAIASDYAAEAQAKTQLANRQKKINELAAYRKASFLRAT